MDKFDKYLEAAQHEATNFPAIEGKPKPGFGKKIKNFVLDKIGAIRGRKIVFQEKQMGNMVPLGEVTFSAESVDQLKNMVGTEDIIIFEGVYQELQRGDATRPHVVVSVDDSGKDVVVQVKRSSRSRMFMMKKEDMPQKGEGE
jgi:hypothetical protein